MRKSTFLSLSWFLLLVAAALVAVGLFKVPVKTWPREENQNVMSAPVLLTPTPEPLGPTNPLPPDGLVSP